MPYSENCLKNQNLDKENSNNLKKKKKGQERVQNNTRNNNKWETENKVLREKSPRTSEISINVNRLNFC